MAQNFSQVKNSDQLILTLKIQQIEKSRYECDMYCGFKMIFALSIEPKTNIRL
jgi:hypothetical protein